jgi:transcriptional regulator with XRE-family HTH domain
VLKTADAPSSTAHELLQRLAVNVLNLRAAVNWSTRALAEHCQLDRRTIQRLENGELRSLSLDKLDALARGLGVRTGSLLGARPVTRKDGERLTREILSENMVVARHLQGWTQAELSDHSGVSRPVIAHIERLQRNADLTTLTKLAAALRTTVERLLTPARAK